MAFDFEGNQLWHYPDVGTGTGGFGSGGAVTLFEDLAIVNASAESESFIALKKSTGEEVWRANGIVQCYNTPTLFGDVLLAEARNQLVALDPRSGSEKWRKSSAEAYICNSPTIVDGIAYITHGGRGPTVALDTAGKEIWSSKFKAAVPSPAVANGLLFIAERDILTCLDSATGGEVFRKRVPVQITDRTYASPLVLGDRILVVTRLDGALVYAAGRELQLLAHNRIAGDDSLFNASPAVSDGRLFLRSEKAIYCIGKP